MPPDAPIDRQQQGLGQGHGQAQLPVGAVLEQLFEVVGHGREQHGFVSPGLAAHVHAPQAVVVNQAAEDGLNRALPDPAHALAPAALLALPRPAIRGVVNGAGELLALGPGYARGLQGALLAVLAGSPIDFAPIAVGRGVVLAKRQHLARGAGVGVRGGVVGEAFDFSLILAEHGYPGRDVLGFQQGVI